MLYFPPDSLAFNILNFVPFRYNTSNSVLPNSEMGAMFFPFLEATARRLGWTREAQRLRQLSKLTWFEVRAGCPISSQPSLLNVPVDWRIMTIGRACNIAMVDRIIMDVIHMSCQIVFIPNAVFPVPASPDATLAFLLAALAGVLCFWFKSRESSLDQRPAHRKISITRRHAP